jgi:formylglycine-generating enzyme required for sulfatase activity
VKRVVPILMVLGLVAGSAALAAEAPAKRHGSFKDCEQCPEMVIIPGGAFTMGSPPDEHGRDEDEGPQHRVTVRRFALGKYEVTFAEWDACVAGKGCPTGVRDRGWGRGKRPVINVSWHYAQRYVAWLRRKTGKRYRLPSEAEWEYAARAGSRTAYWQGTEVGEGQANCDGCGSDFDFTKTAPVGSFPANRFGLHDMIGNVWEWLEDCWHKTYKGAPKNGRAWTTGGNCQRRVIRGGSWKDDPAYLRSAERSWNDPNNRISIIGFRVARSLP